MQAKIILTSGFVIVSTLNLSQIHAAATSMDTRFSNLNNAATSSNQRGGVVSKIADDTIEINAVTYSFSPNQAKIYDLNGRLNPNAEIKAGMFVNFVLNNTKSKPRINELRLISK